MALSDRDKPDMLRDWGEPVHVYQIQKYDDLVSIYRYIKEKYQAKIDAAFDRAAKEIGFVVATSLPVTLEVTGKNVVKTVEFSTENLKDTVFERHVLNEVNGLSNDKISGVRAGTYAIQVIWLDALKIKARRDWVEPAHFRVFDRLFRRPELKPEVQEPVHWHPGLMFDQDTQLLVSIFEEVYPELRLSDRIRAQKEAIHELHHHRPWTEPAHHGPPQHFDYLEPAHFFHKSPHLDRLRYRDWMEPVHYRNMGTQRPAANPQDVLVELSSVLKKYGL